MINDHEQITDEQLEGEQKSSVILNDFIIKYASDPFHLIMDSFQRIMLKIKSKYYKMSQHLFVIRLIDILN